MRHRLPDRRLSILHSCFLVVLLSMSGCSDRDSNWKKCIPVKGKVVADGKPAEGVTVTFNPVEGIDQAKPTITKALTDAEGNFSATTYTIGDGAPAGDYKVTFTWGKLNKISMTFDGDEFKGRYSDPDKSTFRLSVAPDTPVDMGTIELSTKK